jgi:5-methyltetrahydropteroyltriglutamate--homocysteine methyltransferase
MSGFGGVSKRPYGKEFIEYPEFTKKMMERLGEISKVFDAPEAIRERVIAAVDCGFGTFVGWEWVTEDVMWAKLATLRAGADIASQRLWSRKAA